MEGEFWKGQQSDRGQMSECAKKDKIADVLSSVVMDICADNLTVLISPTEARPSTDMSVNPVFLSPQTQLCLCPS